MEPNESPARGAEPRMQGWDLRRVELLGIAVFWTFFGIMGAANRLLDPRGSALQMGNALEPVAVSFFEAYLWAAATPLVFWLSSRLSRETASWPSRILLALGVGVTVSVVVDVSIDVFRVYALDVPLWLAMGVSPVRAVARLWFLDDLILFVAVLAAGFAREYFQRYRVRQAETVQLQAHAARLQAQLAEARLHALRMQLNPHFLFNTLHAVSTLVERDPRGVRRMIARLSELLRYTVEDEGDQEIPVEQELAFLRKYLEIMQIRFQGRLEADLEVEPSARGALVPNLILQPLVENAIKHGASDKPGVARIEVRARREGEQLVVSVSDDGPGLREGARDGVGLRNARARLGQLYGDEHALALRSNEGAGLVAEIRVPFHTGTDLHTAVVHRDAVAAGVGEPVDA